MYYLNKEVWLCADCYAKSAPSRNRKKLVAIGGVLAWVIAVPMVFGSNRDQGTTKNALSAQTTSSMPSSDTANLFRPEEPAKPPTAPPSNDIMTIQTRFIELGYLGGSADGLWGAKSRAALRAFKSAQGFDSDEVWSDTVRQRLFAKNAVRAHAPIASVSTGGPNEAHRRLSALSETDRRAAFALVLSDQSCGAVVRTFYQGSEQANQAAIWNAECRNGKSYVVMIQADKTGSRKVMACDILKAVNGGRCWVKFPI
jgi:peptidoglycan hydrolase-like protein with peptidoglycan-binding domain